MDEAEVHGALIVQPIGYKWEHRYVTHALRTWPSRFVGMCLINPSDPKAPEQLERLVEQEGYRSVRINPRLYPSGLGLDSSVSDRILEKCAELQIPVGYLIDPEHLPDVETLARRHSAVKMIIDHFGHCHTRDGGPDTNPHLNRLIAMARFSNIYVKLTEWPRTSSEPWPHKDLHPWVEALLKAYGPQRLMWGTDFPFIVSQCGYKLGLELLTKETPGISQADMEWLVSKAAERVFGKWG
jgi:predicted TIM-barrel fold metal-dependent hydrolase